LFVESLLETRIKDPFKLVGYVLMPDHFHLLVNPIELNISKVIGKLKGRAASKILKNLRDGGEVSMLNSLKLGRPLASGQTHAAWLQDFSSIDLWSNKFIRQKLNYHSYESSPCRTM
jgi:REP element-mobilizing transposase RayT